MPITEPIDEDELEADLAALEQENLDEKMLKTGTVPVADSLNSLPSGVNGECKFSALLHKFLGFAEDGAWLISITSITTVEEKSTSGGRGRGSRVGQVAGRNGHVRVFFCFSLLLRRQRLRSPLYQIMGHPTKKLRKGWGGACRSFLIYYKQTPMKCTHQGVLGINEDAGLQRASISFDRVFFGFFSIFWGGLRKV